MKLLWKCTWGNGFVSFVFARSRLEAITLLRTELQVGEEEVPAELEPVDHRASFFVTFVPCYEKHEGEDERPHWHGDDFLLSQDLQKTLGEPPPPAPPPPPEPIAADPDEPNCQKCGHPRFASVHHPDYNRPNKCQFEGPPKLEPPPAEVGPERPTSE